MNFLWAKYRIVILPLLVLTLVLGAVFHYIKTSKLQIDNMPSSASKVIDLGPENEKAVQGIIRKAETLFAKLPSREPTNRPALEYANLPRTESTYRKIIANPDVVDMEKIQQAARALVSGTEDEQIEAIPLLAKIGTPEQKEIIEQYAVDPQKEIAVRLTAGENMDWEQKPEMVANLLVTNSPVAEAMIYMASTKELSEKTQELIDNAVYSAFFKSPKPSTQIAILYYFADQHLSQFDDIVDDLSSRITYEGYTLQDREEVATILKKKGTP